MDRRRPGSYLASRRLHQPVIGHVSLNTPLGDEILRVETTDAPRLRHGCLCLFKSGGTVPFHHGYEVEAIRSRLHLQHQVLQAPGLTIEKRLGLVDRLEEFLACRAWHGELVDAID